MRCSLTDQAAPNQVAGVDGCRQGWLAVIARPNLSAPRAEVFPCFATLLAALPTALIVVDMPIGLVTGREGRVVDAVARARLGPRRSSVFTPPCRAALDAPDYPAANAAQRKMTGKGLSKQSWMIAPKMREIDAAMSPTLQSRVREGHPELAFTVAAGAPMAAHKSKLHGLFERLRVLHRVGFDPAALASNLPPDIDAAADDLLDACILAHVAARCLGGIAERFPPAPATDARGLVMEMWA